MDDHDHQDNLKARKSRVSDAELPRHSFMVKRQKVDPAGHDKQAAVPNGNTDISNIEPKHLTQISNLDPLEMIKP